MTVRDAGSARISKGNYRAQSTSASKSPSSSNKVRAGTSKGVKHR